MQPLPDLGAADLGGGGILHQIVQRHATGAAQPGLDVAEADIDVLAQAGLSDRAAGHRDQVGGPDLDVGTLAGDLVRLGHQPVEHALGDRDQRGVRDPGAVMAVAGLALLVGDHLVERPLVGLGVALDRDLRRHAAHLDHQLAVGAQERRGHRHQRAVRQHRRWVAAEFLDEAEDVVPAAAIEAGRMIAQLPEDLVGLEARQDRLDQHRRLDRALGQAELRLGMDEDVVPQTGLEMRFELRQVEIGAAALGQQGPGIVEEIEAEIEQRARHRLAIDQQVLLDQVPAARPDQQHGGLVVEPVRLAGGRVAEGDGPGDGVAQVDLAIDQVGPGRRRGILEIGHEAGGAGVERVDHHLAVGRPGDLDAAVEQVGRQRRHRPLRLADRRGLGEEVRALAGVEPLLPLDAEAQQPPAFGAELAFEPREEGERRRADDGGFGGSGGLAQADAVGRRGPSHHLARGHIVVLNPVAGQRAIAGGQSTVGAVSPNEITSQFSPGPPRSTTKKSVT